MSRDGSVTLVWGDDEYLFRLGLAQWRRIQEKCDAGPGEIYRRLVTIATVLEKGVTLTQAAAMGAIGDWRIDDVREPILQGLVGGGMSEIAAGALVRTRVDPVVDFKTHLALAFGIVKAGLGEVPDEPLGEPAGGAKKPARSPRARSGSRRSTATA
ncbi:hypothetical protein SGCZBJ_03845 [Caulobacter zeae]|uniref:Gene transfer agent family protein n=1 Tax=Caulobacter zeae TaxID=2055137 RepID=A0A2N5DQ09_9CAUL|nr:gene transfer agent family protein [Caulobacter zeae]PLR28150.1 hypothetical protein SGCZBJ_03845 [Caulobacter zeae]